MNLFNWVTLITLFILLIIALYFWNRERNQRIELGYICDEYAKLEKMNQDTLARYKEKIKELETINLKRSVKSTLDNARSIKVKTENIEVKDYSDQPKEEGK